MRTCYSFLFDPIFLKKALQFADRSSHVVYLNPNAYEYKYDGFKHVLAFEPYILIKETSGDNFNSLKESLEANKDWAFGYFSYDLKNELENITFTNTDSINFPLLNFFAPKQLIFFNETTIEIHSTENPETLYRLIQQENLIDTEALINEITIEQTISKEQYIEKVESLRQSILRGDIYETNFCMEYFAKNAKINPLATYEKLNTLSPMPFSAYVKTNSTYLLCASPERFLKKDGDKIISQPIKGTSRRSTNKEEDDVIKNNLENNQKERSENIMIVDLVRNDLSNTAEKGSVKVEELCKIYSFPLVHQMISTVVSTMDKQFHAIDVIQKAFPMGSMTGAPKLRAMELIEALEESYRGLFSGSVGYFTPEMDFDFNVVIRSILYNATTNYLSFQAGSAITYYAEAEKEYEECTIKTKAIRETLS